MQTVIQNYLKHGTFAGTDFLMICNIILNVTDIALLYFSVTKLHSYIPN